MKFLIYICVPVALVACTPPAVAIKTVRDAKPEQVVGCTEIGRVKGVPKVFGPLAQVGLNDARNAAKRIALEQGATDVVFDTVPGGTQAYEINGTAYRC